MVWIDTPWPQDPARLKAGGYDIMRYICSDWNTGPGSSMPNKRIGRPELDGYIAAGVDVAVNFEDAADDWRGGYTRGKQKGQKAGAWMLGALRWPAGGACCSSIDADIGTTWGGLAQEYQTGFAEGLQLEGPYLPGIYGSSIALNGANADGTAHMFWLTAATYWSHGIQPDLVHLRQNGYWPFGGDADLNLTVLEPIGSYLHPLGVDMQVDLSDDALAKVRQQLIAVVGDPYHKYLQDEFAASNKAVLDGVKAILQPAIDALIALPSDTNVAALTKGVEALTAAIAALPPSVVPPTYEGLVSLSPKAPTP